MPEVSVIIPNYNHAPYLKQRIDSVLSQTYQDFEVIILDDLSPDNSREIIEEYRDHPKVSHIILNDVNSGSTFKQWEKGINLARGKYIWIAESDDWCESIFLETILKGLKAEKSCVMGFCQSFCVNNDGDIRWQSRSDKLEKYVNPDLFLERYLIDNNLVSNASTVVFAKSAYERVTDYYKSFKFCGDWVFWAELSRLGSVFVSAKPLNFFRKHDKDVSGAAYLSGKSFIEELKALNYFHSHLQITRNDYLRTKVDRYCSFLHEKGKLNTEVATEISALFHHNEGYEFKKEVLLKTSKIKSRNFFKSFLR